jgi:RNA polymerase sigma-70 factor (ECF subfamily)
MWGGAVGMGNWIDSTGHEWPANWNGVVDRTPAEAADVTAELRTADDRTLVAAFAAGRAEAFDVIVERHRRSVYRLCYRFVNHHEDAADLAQDVFVRAFKGLRGFKGDASLATWLHRVAVNVCLNRAARRHVPSEPIDTHDPADTRARDPLDELVASERARAVQAAIRRLPPRQRATLILRVYQDFSHEEIARALGGSVGAAKANLFHALGALKRALRR